jgi:uncharacterized protein
MAGTSPAMTMNISLVDINAEAAITLNMSQIEGNSPFGFRLRFAILTSPRHCETAMALQLRPNCEYCDKDLPPQATDARICSYECTFCADCVETKLNNVCPNCGGGFCAATDPAGHTMRLGVCTEAHPPSDKRVHLKFSHEDIAAHSARIRNTLPEQ